MRGHVDEEFLVPTILLSVDRSLFDSLDVESFDLRIVKLVSQRVGVKSR